MTDEAKKIKERIEKAKADLKDAIINHLRLLVKTSDKTSAVGNRYISVDLYDHRVLELRNGELIFVNGDMTTYSIDNGDYELSDFEDIIRIETEGREQEVKDKRYREQYKLAQDILNKTGYNIVTCGNCGDVLLHDTNDVDSEGTSNDIVCPSCGFKGESCDFPDLFYV